MIKLCRMSREGRKNENIRKTYKKFKHKLASPMNSVTRLGDFLHFGQLFKAFGNNYLAQSFTFLGNFCKGVKIYHFSSEIIFSQLL